MLIAVLHTFAMFPQYYVANVQIFSFSGSSGEIMRIRNELFFLSTSPDFSTQTYRVQKATRISERFTRNRSKHPCAWRWIKNEKKNKKQSFIGNENVPAANQLNNTKRKIYIIRYCTWRKDNKLSITFILRMIEKWTLCCSHLNIYQMLESFEKMERSREGTNAGENT